MFMGMGDIWPTMGGDTEQYKEWEIRSIQVTNQISCLKESSGHGITKCKHTIQGKWKMQAMVIMGIHCELGFMLEVTWLK